MFLLNKILATIPRLLHIRESIGGKEYRTKVLDYVAKEDSPRSLNYQLDLMKKVGFSTVEILHKNSCFAAYGGIK